MRFVDAKTEAQQAAAGIHRVREALIKQQTAMMNSLRVLMGEFGIFTAKVTKAWLHRWPSSRTAMIAASQSRCVPGWWRSQGTRVKEYVTNR
jgi:hypothetical protein